MSLNQRTFIQAGATVAGSLTSERMPVETSTMGIFGLKLSSPSSFSGGFELRWSPTKTGPSFPLPIDLQQSTGSAPVANCRYLHGTAVTTAAGTHTGIVKHIPSGYVFWEWTVTAGSIVVDYAFGDMK